tara:strand:- start:209 stop:535 length:327 start_codon:yes stop_codon:yes gene_type:complete
MIERRHSFDTADAMASLRPGASYTIRSSKGVDDKIEWLDTKQTLPTDAELNTEKDRLQAEYDAQEYARNRQAEYPSIQELVVALYDTDDKADIEAKRAAVKKKYPKPE